MKRGTRTLPKRVVCRGNKLACPCRKTRSPSSTALRSRWSSQRGFWKVKKLRGKSASTRLRPGALRRHKEVGDSQYQPAVHVEIKLADH